MSDDAARAEVAAKLRAGKLQATNGAGGGRRLLHLSPAQWKQFERSPQFGKLIKTARILPIRAPLSSIYEIHFSGNANYSPSGLMEKLIASARSGSVVNVGAVIDATGESYFLHDLNEWEDWDVEYLKLDATFAEDDDEPTREAKEDEMVGEFCKAIVKQKQGEKKDMDVAVFGAFDSNLVGFLVVSLLVEYCEMNLDSALAEFAAANPPGIYSRRYLERLYRKYYSTLPSEATTLACPAPPKWSSIEPSKGGDIGPGVLTDDDKLRKFERMHSLLATSAPTKAETAATSVNGNGKTTGGTAFPAPPVYKPPMYIPPDRSDSRPAKRRKIRSWLDDVSPLSYGETLDTSSEEHAKLTKSLEKLTGIEGFPGCEVVHPSLG